MVFDSQLLRFGCRIRESCSQPFNKKAGILRRCPLSDYGSTTLFLDCWQFLIMNDVESVRCFSAFIKMII